MTSQADFDRYVDAQRGVRKLLVRDLNAWWTEVQHLSPGAIRREAETFLPLLANTYGEVSAAAAADFYELARASSAARGTFTAVMSDSTAGRDAARRVRWATAPLFGGDFEGALGRMALAADEAALQQGRNTIMTNSERDPAVQRFARVPVGKTCAWCLMLASRGAVYRSAATAGAAGQYHGGSCDCQPVPSWGRTGSDLPPSYDEGHLYGLYERARESAGSGSPKAITRAFRRLDGGVHVADGVPN